MSPSFPAAFTAPRRRRPEHCQSTRQRTHHEDHEQPTDDTAPREVAEQSGRHRGAEEDEQGNTEQLFELPGEVVHHGVVRIASTTMAERDCGDEHGRVRSR